MSEQNEKPGVKVVPVQSRFSRMALRGGGIAAEDAIAAADSIIEQQRSRYFDWVTADLAALDEALNLLYGGSGMPSHHDAAYYKSAQIRDLGGTFGYDVITDVANSLCELLYRMRAARRYSRDCIEAHQSALKLVCTKEVETMPLEAQDALVSGLQRVVDKYPQPAAPRD